MLSAVDTAVVGQDPSLDAETSMADGSPARPRSDVLAVDLDGTLLRTDVSYESVALLLKRPWSLLSLAFHLVRGRAALKKELARRVDLDVTQLPVNLVLLEWLKREQGRERVLELYSASNNAIVQRVSERFGIFRYAQGSDGRLNLAGEAKWQAIRARCGPMFTYAGDSHRDVVIWRQCGSAVLVGDVERLRGFLSDKVTVEESFPVPRGGARQWLRALRAHQWIKNVLVFVPLLLSGFLAPGLALASLLAFVAISLAASASYVVNDLMDLAADRAHPSKRERPFASAALSIRSGLLALPLLAGATAVVLLALPWRASVAVMLYAVCSVAYSAWLKRAPVLDLIVLALLFTLRLVAGMFAIGEPLSPWLLTFSMFFFFSIATIKRYDEVRVVAMSGPSAIPGRGYRTTDGTFLMSVGLSSGFCSALVFFIYLVDPASPSRSYSHPELMWIICVILAYWLGRAWLIASRGGMHVDPVLFALRDRVTLALGALTLVVSLAARW